MSRRIALTMLLDVTVWLVAVWLVAGAPPPPAHLRARHHQIASRAYRRAAAWCGRRGIHHEAAYWSVIRP